MTAKYGWRRSRVTVGLICFVLGLTAFGTMLALRPVTSLALDENKCLTCHGNPDFAKTTPGGEKTSLYVDVAHVDVSAHRFIDCTTCHTNGFNKIPHTDITPLTKQSLAEKCGSCHKYEYKLHLESIHGQQLAQGNNDVATCTDCHSDTSDPHNVKRVLQPDSSTFVKSIADTCAKCHDNPELMASYGKVEDVYSTYMRSFHGKATLLANTELTQLDKATCVSCHGVHDIKDTDDPTSPVAGKENLANVCEKCHAGAGLSFANSFLGHRDAATTSIKPVHTAEIIFSTLLKTVLAAGALIVLLAIFRYSMHRWKD